MLLISRDFEHLRGRFRWAGRRQTWRPGDLRFRFTISRFEPSRPSQPVRRL